MAQSRATVTPPHAPSAGPKPRGRGRPTLAQSDLPAHTAFARFVTTCTLDRAASSPLWVQVKNALSHGIETGQLAPNSRLPSEQEMTKAFQVSRQVLRAALSALVSEQLILKQPRLGIFVKGGRKDVGFMTSALGVHEDLTARGFDVSVQTYSAEQATPDVEEQAGLELPDGFDVVRYVRVYRIDGQPITHSVITLPAHRVPGILDAPLDENSLFQTLRTRYGLRLAQADREITARIVPPQVSHRLELPDGTAALYIVSRAYDPEGGPLEFYRSYYNADVAPIRITAGSDRRQPDAT